EIVSSIQVSMKSMWDSGVTVIGDISSNFISYNYLLKSKMFGRVYWEYLSLKPSDVNNRLDDLTKSIEQTYKPQNLIKQGISPHSTYTLCDEAFETIVSYIKNKGYHTAIHVGESIEEQQLFYNRSGKLFEFINSYIPLSKDIYKTSPLKYLHSKGYLVKDSMLIHLNILEDDEIHILKNLNLSVIHCPMSHNYFNHPTFKLKTLLDYGVNIAIGTDSLASAYSLNFFEQLKQMKLKFPFLTHENIINMATISGAKAMQLNNLGEIIINKSYSLIGIFCHETTSNPYETVIENNFPIIHRVSNNKNDF
ncbi:MAG: amidohydrolase family protein, partial [Spirochaetota bacterium]|nr:amidohydrolase family protein [Spirochaetota bacterium]